MEIKEYIPVVQLCEHYRIEVSFFQELHEVGLINLVVVEHNRCLHQEDLGAVERMMRIHQELGVNIAGVDVILNLMQRMEALKTELNGVRNRLRFYEND